VSKKIISSAAMLVLILALCFAVVCMESRSLAGDSGLIRTATSLAFNQPNNKKLSKEERTKNELMQLEREIGKANITREYAFFDRIEAEECIFTDSGGGITTKKEDLESLKTPEQPDSKLVAYDVDQMVVSLYDKTAVVTGRVTTKRLVKGKEVVGLSRFTDVFVWRDRRWQLVAGHSSGIRQSPKNTAMTELLHLHEQQRVAHVGKNAELLVSMFADDFVNVSDGKISRPSREESLRRFTSYLERSSFLEWDDISPPVIRVSEDASMAYVIVHKRVRLNAANEKGALQEESTVFAWMETYEKRDGKWGLSAIASTKAPDGK